MTAPQVNSRRSLRRLVKTKNVDLSNQEKSVGKVVHERLAQMEAQLTRLGEAFDQNTDVFSESLKYAESMHLIFQRVLNDMANGTLRCLGDEEYYRENPSTSVRPVDPENPKKIDFHSYIREYWLCMAFTDFAVNCRRVWDEAHPEQKGPGPILAPEGAGDQVVVFGGG